METIFGSSVTYTGTFLSMLILAIFLENTVFTRALGTSTVLLMLRKKANLLLFGGVLTLITVIASVLAFWVNPLLADSPNKYYVTPIVYVLIISLVYIVALVVVKRLLKSLAEELVPMIHLSAFNCAVFGALLLANSYKMTLASTIGFGLGSGLGFTLAALMLAISYNYLNSDNIPKAFRGFPITMIYVGILSLAFYGLIGHQLPV